MMIELPNKDISPGLYLCATPIGNLGDITLRALSLLFCADAIYAEDTRNTLKLLNHYGIKKPIISCHEHNERIRGAEIAEKIAAGYVIVYVSDAGMPGISDPGRILIEECVKKGVFYTVIPGASAAATAHVLSGLSDTYRFEGFLPRDNGARKKRINALRFDECCLIFYESPLRVAALMLELYELLGDRDASLVREITKLHESVVSGTLKSLYEKFSAQPPKGECVLVVAGAKDEELTGTEDIDMLLRRLLDSGYSARDAAKEAARLMGIPKNDAYRLALDIIGK
ncbi:MAG: 16S rRNA (cytidine(1402)-2'-O)-methyltransferase [Clostridia bacterium]|nr:16S rRNA (cytidine(1402)-2'-O)-methyltransferase [Clostridia bacterium]